MRITNCNWGISTSSNYDGGLGALNLFVKKEGHNGTFNQVIFPYDLKQPRYFKEVIESVLREFQIADYIDSMNFILLFERCFSWVLGTNDTFHRRELNIPLVNPLEIYEQYLHDLNYEIDLPAEFST